jgi:hypothetical protein
VASRLPVQVLGVPVRGDHIRSAGVSRCLGVPVRGGRMLPGKGAGVFGIVAVGPAFLQIKVALRRCFAKTRATAGTGVRKTPDPEMNRGTGTV